jgi:hypothetical protein
MKHCLALLAAAAALAACTETPQTIGSNAKRDQPAFQGTGSSFVAPGWKPGDEASWVQQLKARAQNQNEYTKVN